MMIYLENKRIKPVNIPNVPRELFNSTNSYSWTNIEDMGIVERFTGQFWYRKISGFNSRAYRTT